MNGDGRRCVSGTTTAEEGDWRAVERDPGVDRPARRYRGPPGTTSTSPAIVRRSVVDEHARAWVEGYIENVNRALEPHERIERFELVSTEWTPENDLLTPSLKKKRRNILDRFEAEVGADLRRGTAGGRSSHTPTS